MILNKNKDQIPPDAVYIGRGSKWGNPFKIGPDGSRSEVIFKYEQWLKNQPDLLSSIDELKNKALVCFCKPSACHGDVLVKVLTMTPNQRIVWETNLGNWNNFFEEE